jgi:ABC-type Fe3+ transport system substrate-binding protein
VEDYLPDHWAKYLANIRSLPTDDSSLFIRFLVAARITEATAMKSLPAQWPGRSY